MSDAERRRDFLELRQILFWQWDPLGVRGAFPNSAGEYDPYAWELLGLLEHEAGEDEVAAYLHRVEVGWITQTVPDEHRARVAEAVAWWFLRRRGTGNEARLPRGPLAGAEDVAPV